MVCLWGSLNSSYIAINNSEMLGEQVNRLPQSCAEPQGDCVEHLEFQQSASCKRRTATLETWATSCHQVPITSALPCLDVGLTSLSSRSPNLTAPGLRKLETLNLRLIIPQWYSEFSRTWQTWQSFWTAPCPTGRKTIFRLFQDRAWGACDRCFLKEIILLIGTAFCRCLLGFHRLQLLSISNIRFTFILAEVAFFFFLSRTNNQGF